MEFPEITPFRQLIPPSELGPPRMAARAAWLTSNVVTRIRPGTKVAIAVGSRGIVALAELVRGTVDFVRDCLAEPFIVAAMGSHGGATAEGQAELLASYGVTPETLGVPVVTDMATTIIGHNSWGEPVHWDRNALAADVVLSISRVKPHTDFRGRFESGIVKMLVIGLGKRDGAAQHHRWGLRGLRDMMPESVKVILEKTRFLAGLAVLENAREEPARLEVVSREHLLDREPLLLDEARQLMGRLPIKQLDVLVIGEIGKNYSGAGIDPNVVGRLLLETSQESLDPCITRIVALDLSPESHGNGVGIGLADLCPERLIQAIDPVPLRMNTLTACFLGRSKLPLSFPEDSDCLRIALQTCWQPDPQAVRLAIIPNTLELEYLWASPPLAAEWADSPHLQQLGPSQPMPFLGDTLDQVRLFPHSTRGRRSSTAHI